MPANKPSDLKNSKGNPFVSEIDQAMTMVRRLKTTMALQSMAGELCVISGAELADILALYVEYLEDVLAKLDDAADCVLLTLARQGA